jgi:hypothetical protein
MKQLRQLIYLDEYKLYSLYSQIFAGFTDHIVNYAESSTVEEEKQKGPMGSGRLLADLAIGKEGQQEKRFLHDYVFTLFEEELKKQQKVLEYDSTSPTETLDSLAPGLFVKVKGLAIFNDIKAICDMIAKFNQFGEAIAYVTNYEDIDSTKDIVEQKLKEEKDRNARAKIKTASKRLRDTTKLAQEAGLYYDPEFMEKIGYLFDHGYEGQFELMIRPNGQRADQPFFSALLKRDYLREDAPLLVKKYSRRAQGEFCLLGIVCQCPNAEEEEVEIPEDSEPQHQHLREVLGQMVSSLTLIEKGFMGRLENETILDPIAVYREV